MNADILRSLPAGHVRPDITRHGAGGGTPGVLSRWHLHLLSLGHPEGDWSALAATAGTWGYDVSLGQARTLPQLARDLAELPPCDLLVLVGDAAELAAGGLPPGTFTAAHWQRLLNLPGVLVIHLSGQPGDEALGSAFARAGASGYLAPRGPLRGAEAQAYVLELLYGWREQAVQLAMAVDQARDPAAAGRLSPPSRQNRAPATAPSRGVHTEARGASRRLRLALSTGRRSAQALLSALSLALLPVLGALGTIGVQVAHAHEGQHDDAAVRQALMTMFDRPESRLTVTPVVVIERHAVAGWMQGERGGRALLERNAKGDWLVVLCSGSALRDAKFLRDNGMGAPAAERMAQTLAKAETALSAAQRTQLDSFDGLVRMDAQGRHPPMDHGGGHGAGHGAGHGGGHGQGHGQGHGAAHGQGHGAGHGAAQPPAAAASGGAHKHH